MKKLAYIGLIVSLIFSCISTLIEIILESKDRSGFFSKLSISLQVLLGGIIDALLMIVITLFFINNFL